MVEVFDAKLRRVGNSMGVIIPREVIETLGYRQGDMVHVALPSAGIAARNDRLRELAGAYKGKGAFQREKGDRY